MLVNSRSIIYIVVVLVFLEGCSSDNVHRYHNKRVSRSMHSDVMIDISPEKKINIWYPQKISVNATNIHKYNNINYNSYQKSKYTVKSGDTLFYIAWITGNNYLDLAKINNIKDINVLKVDQVLRVHHNTIWLYLKKISFFVKKQLFCFSKTHNQDIYPNTNNISCNMTSYPTVSEPITVKKWYWPTNGTIINTFSDSERGNKGIDISGTLGQPILATASGRVVYIGNTLKGYGNLIILKHNNNYLSAYAHNDKILVTEQQTVKIGEKIATMGNSGTNKVKLHFEIRYKGKSVDPLYYLQNK